MEISVDFIDERKNIFYNHPPYIFYICILFYFTFIFLNLETFHNRSLIIFKHVYFDP